MNNEPVIMKHVKSHFTKHNTEYQMGPNRKCRNKLKIFDNFPKPFKEKRIVFSTNVTGTTVYLHVKE